MQSTPQNFFTGDFKTKQEPEDEILILILLDRWPLLCLSENPFEIMRRGQHIEKGYGINNSINIIVAWWWTAVGKSTGNKRMYLASIFNLCVMFKVLMG